MHNTTTKPRKMNKTNFNLLLPVIILLLFNPSPTAHSKSVIEPCNSSDSCPSLLSYNLPFDSKLSEIAYKFNINITYILSSNSLDPSTPPSEIIPSKTLIKIPISCPCIDGIRRSLSTFYTVGPSDTVDSISEVYGRLVSGEQIESVNGVSEERPLMSGERIVIELPCTCFGNENDEGVSAVYLSYVVQSGDSLSRIGWGYGTTVGELQEINGLEQARVDPGDVLAIPIPACSSVNLNLYNESLIVPNGSYALTANDCIKCTCGPFDLNLQCMPSGIMVPCSHLHCKGSNLYIGDSSEDQTPFGCNITQCIYRGHSGHKIFRRLAKSSHPQCSGNINIGAVGSPLSLPSPTGYGVVPFSILSPSPSPFASYGPEGTDGPNPTRRQSGNSHRDEGWLTIQTSFLAFFLLVLVGSVFF